MGECLLLAAVAVTACLLPALGLPAFRDVEFQVLVFEDLSVAALAGSWLGVWGWCLGALNALLSTLLLYHMLGARRLSVVTSVIVSLFAGSVATVLGAAALVVVLLTVFFLVGLVFMVFAGPF